VVILVLFAVLASELALQLLLQARRFFGPGLLASRYRYDELINYTLMPDYKKETPYRVTTTNEGTRRTSDPVAGGENIAVMGGSTTFCSLVGDHESWPFWLEQALRDKGYRINVINFGIPSQHCNHHIGRYARDVAPKKPKLSIFFLNVNDAQLFKHADLRGKPRNYATLKSVTGRLRKRPPTPFALVRFMRLVTDKIRGLKTRIFFKSEYQYTLSEKAANWMPDEGCMAHYRQCIRQLAGLARDAGSIPVFIIPPHIFRDHHRISILSKSEENIFHFENENIRYWLGYLVNWRKKQITELKKAEEYGANIIDLSNIFEPELSTDITKVKKITGDGVHFNANGNEIFGRHLAQRLVDQNILTGPTQGSKGKNISGASAE